MMRERVLATFRGVYGRAPAYLIRAPGRANLIGGHTDYNDGFVLPLAIDRAIWLAIAPREDDRLVVHSIDFGGETARFSLGRLMDEGLPHWSGHVRGAWWLMMQKGYEPPGADIVLGGDVPIGAGVSSSAAIGVAVIEAVLAVLGDETHSQVDKALLAVELEHAFLNVPCGVMDQIASAAAIDGSAMLLDCRSLEIAPVGIPVGVRVVVMNTMKSRALNESAYGERRGECEAAAEALGVPALRDAAMDMLEAAKGKLTDVQVRRARHVITENERTLEARAALEGGDLEEAGRLISASHASLRDDFEVSCRELDVMSALAQGHPACYGARMMGGGFGGSVVGLVRGEAVGAFVEEVAADYEAETGLAPQMVICKATAGSEVVRMG
jgi:galactokinase